MSQRLMKGFPERLNLLVTKKLKPAHSIRLSVRSILKHGTPPAGASQPEIGPDSPDI